MVSRTCWIYSEQELTLRAIEVIKSIKKENGYDDVKFLDVNVHGKPSNGKVLVFGSRAPEGVWEGVEFIHTYSIAQIMAKANAATVLTSSLQLYFNGVHKPPVDSNWIVGRSNAKFYLSDWDFDAPTAIDIETSGNLGETHTPEEVEIISVAFYQEGRRPLVIVSPDSDSEGSPPLWPDQLENLSELLPKFTKAIYHNGKFDTRVLNRVLGIKLCVWFDTMLAHHVLNHAAGMHGLKELAQRYLGAPEWEADLKKYTKGGGYYELIPFSELLKYNGWDVYWTYQLWKLFAPQIEIDENNQKAFMFEMAVADTLLNVEMNGIPFHVENSNLLKEENELRMSPLLTAMRKYASDAKFNPNSHQQVKRVLENVYHISVQSTKKEVLEELAAIYEGEEVSMWCSMLLEYRGLAKQNSTYVDGWGKHARKLPGDTQKRVRPTFLVHGTSTGRLSSTSPNAQNVPRNKTVRKIVTLEGNNDA